MQNKNAAIFLLRIVHGFFALYFLICLIYIYYCALLKAGNLLLVIAVISVLVEGVLLYVINKGDCIFIHIQRRLGDNKPFFNLLLPEQLAKKAIPYFTILTIIGLLFLLLRFILQAG